MEQPWLLRDSRSSMCNQIFILKFQLLSKHTFGVWDCVPRTMKALVLVFKITVYIQAKYIYFLIVLCTVYNIDKVLPRYRQLCLKYLGAREVSTGLQSGGLLGLYSSFQPLDLISASYFHENAFMFTVLPLHASTAVCGTTLSCSSYHSDPCHLSLVMGCLSPEYSIAFPEFCPSALFLLCHFSQVIMLFFMTSATVYVLACHHSQMLLLT